MENEENKTESRYAYKGFNADMTCHNFQYEVGGTYKIDGEVQCCENGFHACANPFEVFYFYPPAHSRYCYVKQFGTVKFKDGGTKAASSDIDILSEMSLYDMIKEGIKFLIENKNNSKEKGFDELFKCVCKHDSICAVLKGYSCAETTGVHSIAIANSWISVALTKETRSKAIANDDYSVAMCLKYDSVAIAEGTESVAETKGNNSVSMTKGLYSQAICNKENSIAVCTNWHSTAEANSSNSIAFAASYDCKAKGAVGSWLVLVEYGEREEILDIKTVKVDGKKIKADTYYELKNGKIVEAE